MTRTFTGFQAPPYLEPPDMSLRLILLTKSYHYRVTVSVVHMEE